MTAKPKDRTAPTRKAAERRRKREAGLRPVEVWVPAITRTADVQKHIAKLTEQSE